MCLVISSQKTLVLDSGFSRVYSSVLGSKWVWPNVFVTYGLSISSFLVGLPLGCMHIAVFVAEYVRICSVSVIFDYYENAVGFYHN